VRGVSEEEKETNDQGCGGASYPEQGVFIKGTVDLIDMQS